VVEDNKEKPMYKSKNPKIVDTPKAEGAISTISYARTNQGRVDLGAYTGLKGTIIANGLNVDVKINKARIRYGHLDLNVTPTSGTGNVWVERKNIEIPADPAAKGKKKKVLKNDSKKPANNASFPASEIQQMVRAIMAEQASKAKN